MYESNDKMVSHPSHYQSSNGLEVIDVIEAFTSDLRGIEAVDIGNALKYTCRWKHKNGVQDLKKAVWYLTHLIEHLEQKDKNIQIQFVPDATFEEIMADIDNKLYGEPINNEGE